MSNYRKIAKILEQNTGAQRLGHVFEDFVHLSALSFRNAVDRADHEAWALREKQYLEVADKYSRDQLTRFAEALALVVEQMETEPADILGRLYMELDLGNERLGQFYTPYDVAVLMAQMLSDTLIERVRDRGYAELYEPACGAGAFLVATTQVMRSAGLNPQTQLRVVADDIAATPVHMTYIHLSLLHVPALVHRRNTLTQETFESWPTPAYLVGPSLRAAAALPNLLDAALDSQGLD